MAERKLFPLTVDELNFKISALFRASPELQAAVVRGEMAELKRHTSGHVYFTLLGEESRVSCALFRNSVPNVPQWPQNGDEVLAEGAVSVYPPRGSYQLIVRRLVPLGKGAAERARLELERRLEKEGIFDPRLKRPLPPYPEKVAVVTSATGAALRDVLIVAGKRMPSCAIVIAPAQVQGYEAPEEIVAALGRAGRVEGAECVLLVRGGGSRDDLTPFDDERVVRAVRSCPIPIVVGVGHEVDETLSDKAADLRAATPSAAAERVFPDRREVSASLAQKKRLAAAAMEGRFTYLEKDVETRLSRAVGAVDRALAEKTGAVDRAFFRLKSGGEKALSAAGEKLGALGGALNSLSPLKVFDRGYNLCEKDGRPVASIKDLIKGDNVTLRFTDGDAGAVVESLSARE